MRGAPPELAHLICAVDRIAAKKEDRMRHRRIVVAAGIMHPAHHGRAKAATRGAVAPAPGRDAPGVAQMPVHIDMHGLWALISTRAMTPACAGAAISNRGRATRSSLRKRDTGETPHKTAGQAQKQLPKRYHAHSQARILNVLCRVGKRGERRSPSGGRGMTGTVAPSLNSEFLCCRAILRKPVPTFRVAPGAPRTSEGQTCARRYSGHAGAAITRGRITQVTSARPTRGAMT